MSAPHRSPLRDQLQIGSLTVHGRLFKSATSETRSSIDGFVTDELLEFYRPIADAHTPLIVTGNLYVSEQGKSAYRQAGIDCDDKKSGLREWVDVAHDGGSALIAQLNHGGRQLIRTGRNDEPTVSASTVREPLFGTKPRSLRTEEMAGIVNQFADAAERARDVGLDGVQIHAAHGYLISEFHTPHTNRRTDEYGGTILNRMRLLREVYRRSPAAGRRRLPDPAEDQRNRHDAAPARSNHGRAVDRRAGAAGRRRPRAPHGTCRSIDASSCAERHRSSRASRNVSRREVKDSTFRRRGDSCRCSVFR